MIIELYDLERAISFLIEAERRMLQAFSGVGKAKLAEVLSGAWSYIAMNKVVKLSDLMTKFMYEASGEEIESVIRSLEAMKVIHVGTSERDAMLYYKGTKGMENQHGIGD